MDACFCSETWIWLRVVVELMSDLVSRCWMLFPKQCGRGSCGKCKGRHRGVRLIRCYLQYIHASRTPRSEFRLHRLAKFAWPRRVLVATPLSLWCRAHFRTSWPLFVTGAGESSWFGGPKSTFRDRRKGSERFDFEMQISWQAQFGHDMVIFDALEFRDRCCES